MPTVTLDGRTAPTLPCPAEKTREIIYWADDLPGFGLRCRGSGGRSWFVQYRTKAGEMRKHTLGDPETVPFAKARKEAERLLAAVKLGNDPAGDAMKAKHAIKIGELVTRYLEHQQSRMKPRSYAELTRHLNKHASPMHRHKAGDATQRAVVELLQELAREAPVTANRVRASLSAMFAWGMKAGLVSANPVAATFKPAAEKPRERVLTDGELARIWASTDGGADHDRIVRLLMLTGARREEIAGMRWGEIVMNADGTATWVLPSERSKNHLAHELTLPRMLAELLPAVRERAGGMPRELVFGEGAGPFSGWSRCKERLDARLAKAAGGQAHAPWVLHDLRRTFVTRLNDMGVEPHVIEALVNHSSGAAKAGVAGVYNRSAYAAQKRAALARWCEHVSRLVEKSNDSNGTAPPEQNESAGKIIPMRRAG